MEPGCANGALTERLATRCDALVAFDLLDAPVQRARARLAHLPHVEVRTGRFPDDWPPGTGDLAVWSEIAYYLDDDASQRALRHLHHYLEPGGALVAVHYTGTTNYPRTGSEIGRWLDGVDFIERQTAIADPDFELGVWRRRS